MLTECKICHEMISYLEASNIDDRFYVCCKHVDDEEDWKEILRLLNIEIKREIIKP